MASEGFQIAMPPLSETNEITIFVPIQGDEKIILNEFTNALQGLGVLVSSEPRECGAIIFVKWHGLELRDMLETCNQRCAYLLQNEPFRFSLEPVFQQELQGVILAYPDQNILSRLAFGELPNLQNYIDNQSIKLCLSFTHSEEINQIQIPGKREQVCQYILDKQLYCFEQHMGKETASLYKMNGSALAVFLEKAESDPAIDRVVDLQMQFLHKQFGGQKDKTPIEIVEEQKQSFADDLFQPMRENLGSVFDELIAEIQKHSALQNNDFKASDEVWKQLTIKKSSISQITPPNVILQIWDLLKNDIWITAPNMTLEQFIGLTSDNIVTLDGQVTVVMCWLNLIGYWPDQKITDENKFRASFRDMLHASHALYTGLIISQDNRFCKKLLACFEYLKLDIVILQRNEIHSKEDNYEVIWPLKVPSP